MSKLALYRKYRPQGFADICGQHHVKITLANELLTGKVAHAYLFTGPRGVGKTSMARILAKAVNCLNRKTDESEPCNACEACADIAAGKAMDVMEIDAASNTGVDNVRENVIENVRFGPSRLKYKIFIVDEVHMLSTSAFNALLKTLEEPPAHAIFILATTEFHKVPATIVSRCQRFDFRRIAFADLTERLAHLSVGEDREVAPEVLSAIARASGGSLRDAESVLGQVLAVTDGKVGVDEASIVLPRSDIALALRFLEAATNREAGKALAAVAEVADEGVDPLRFIEDCVSVLRKTLLVALERGSDAIAGEFDAETEKALVKLTTAVGVGRLVDSIELLLSKRGQIKDLDHGLLPLELAAVELTLLGNASAAAVTSPASAAIPSVRPVSIEPESKPVASSQLPVAVQTLVKPQVAPAKPEPERPLTPADQIKTVFEDVRRHWQDLIRAVGEINHSLPFILNVTTPVRVEAGKIVVGSRYPFHCDKLNSEKYHKILVDASEKVFGERIGFDAIISDEAPFETPGDVAAPTGSTESDPALAAVLSALGGKVVGM